jgi:hypothetical protein
MKFGQTLKRDRLPEWSRAYIAYAPLKKLIKKACASRNGLEVPEDSPEDAEDDAEDDDQEREGNTDLEDGRRPGGSSRSSLRSLQANAEQPEVHPSFSRASTTSEFNEIGPPATLRFRRKPGGGASTVKG